MAIVCYFNCIDLHGLGEWRVIINSRVDRSTIIIYVAVGVGPKNFPLDCRMAIFYSTVEDNVAPSASILCQISSLVSLNLLAQVTSDDQIDCPKYKCLVNFLTDSEIAKQLKFNIVQYLYDFVYPLILC